jgi:hypothetical protein
VLIKSLYHAHDLGSRQIKVIALSTNYGSALLELIRAGEAPIQAIEVGPWMSVGQIRQAQQALPGWTWQFHPGNLISGVGWLPGTLPRLKSWIDCTYSRWASFHATFLPPGYAWAYLKWGWRLPVLRPAAAGRMLCCQVERARRALGLPVILENVAPLPDPDGLCDYRHYPELLGTVIEKTGCGLLLDLGHARIAAQHAHQPACDYLGRLPLEKTRQVHVSGPRQKDGVLFDAHQPLGEEDYNLLEWTLARTCSEVVTLEYYQEKDPLRQQLSRLAAMLSASMAARSLPA